MSVRIQTNQRHYCRQAKDGEPTHLVCCVRNSGPTVSVCGLPVSGAGPQGDRVADCTTCREKDEAFPDNCPVFGRCIT